MLGIPANMIDAVPPVPVVSRLRFQSSARKRPGASIGVQADDVWRNVYKIRPYRVDSRRQSESSLTAEGGQVRTRVKKLPSCGGNWNVRCIPVMGRDAASQSRGCGARGNCHWGEYQVALHFYAIRVEEHRLVAAEIDSAAAASLLVAAQPLLLGTAEDLAKVAQRLRRPLVTIARAVPSRSSAAARTPLQGSHTAASTPLPEPVAALPQRDVHAACSACGGWLGASRRRCVRPSRIALPPNSASRQISRTSCDGLDRPCRRWLNAAPGAGWVDATAPLSCPNGFGWHGDFHAALECHPDRVQMS